MSSAADTPDAVALTRALDVLDELHRNTGDDGLRAIAELHRRRRVGALLVAVRACAADRRARAPDTAATTEALADMRAGAARSPMLHTLARALERVNDADGPSVAGVVGKLLGEVPDALLEAIEDAVARGGTRLRSG